MAARRNRRLRSAAAVTALGSAVAIGAHVCFAIALYRYASPPWAAFSRALDGAGVVVATGGWFLVVGAIRDRIEWVRLGLATRLLAIGAWISFVAIALGFYVALANPAPTRYRISYGFDVLSCLLLALVATVVMAAVRGEAGPVRGRRLRNAAVLFAGGFVAALGVAIFAQAYYSSYRVSGALTAGLTLQAAGMATIAAAAVVAAFAFRRIAAGREGILAIAGTVGAAAWVLTGLGEALFNAHLHEFHYPGIQVSGGWILVASRLASVAAIAIAASAFSAVEDARGRHAQPGRRDRRLSMLAERNRLFRICAQVVAVVYLVYAAHDLIYALHHSPEAPTADLVSEILFVLVRLIEVGGWFVVATAFEDEVDWQRLWLGGGVIVLALVIEYVARVVYLVPYVDVVHSGDYRSSLIWTAIGALLTAIGAWILVSGLVPSRLGEARASRIWLGLIGITAGAGAATVAAIYDQSFYSGVHAAHATTIALLIQTVGAFGLALSFLVLALRVRRPFAEREATLSAAAAAVAAAFLCWAVGELILANYAGSHGSLQWVTDALWLSAAHWIGLAIAAFFVARGAKAARETSSVGGRLGPAEE